MSDKRFLFNMKRFYELPDVAINGTVSNLQKSKISKPAGDNTNRSDIALFYTFNLDSQSNCVYKNLMVPVKHLEMQQFQLQNKMSVILHIDYYPWMASALHDLKENMSSLYVQCIESVADGKFVLAPDNELVLSADFLFKENLKYTRFLSREQIDTLKYENENLKSLKKSLLKKRPARLTAEQLKKFDELKKLAETAIRSSHNNDVFNSIMYEEIHRLHPFFSAFYKWIADVNDGNNPDICDVIKLLPIKFREMLPAKTISNLPMIISQPGSEIAGITYADRLAVWEQEKNRIISAASQKFHNLANNIARTGKFSGH